MENIEIARLVLKNIEADPESLWMGSWGHASDCGTFACIAGHTLLAAGYELRNGEYFNTEGVPVDADQEARRVLGFGYGEFTRHARCGLFYIMDSDRALAAFRELIEEEEARRA